MKRLALMVFAAAWVGGTASAQTALPRPTGMTVTPTGGTSAGAVQTANFTAGPRVGGVLKGGLVGDWSRSSKVWCEDCAPAVRHPLPPAPVACATGACATPGAGCGGSCWERFKEWFCFRQTPVHVGYVPTPRTAPFHTYFRCTETAGCASGNCGPGGCGPRAGVVGQRCQGPGCTPCPTPGEAVMPGFRFAQPGATGHAALPPLPAPAAEVVPSSYRAPITPTTMVPYRMPR